MRRLEHACGPALTAAAPALDIDLRGTSSTDRTAAAVLKRLAARGARIAWPATGGCLLEKLSTLGGAIVHALDGDLGSVDDFYFDDDHWVVRYVIVDTGKWLPGRRVVLSVMSLDATDWDGRRVPVKLARQQIRNSPDLLSHPAVSRALESELLSYYGYAFYWAGDALWGAASSPALVAAATAARVPPQPPGTRHADDTRLHSMHDVIGYHVHASDGEIGHIDDLLVNPTDWSVEAILVDTSNWIGGRSVAIAPSSIGRIDWAGRHLRVNLSRSASHDA